MVRIKELREGGSRGAGAQDSKDTGSGPLGPQQGGSCVQLSEAGASPRPAGTGFAGNKDKEQEPWVDLFSSFSLVLFSYGSLLLWFIFSAVFSLLFPLLCVDLFLFFGFHFI